MSTINKKTLFASDSINAGDYIVLNWHGQPIKEFGLYAEAYHCAAKRLTVDYGTTGAIRDFEALPIIFLYRHAFELYLKAFIICGLSLLPKHVSFTMEEVFKTHRLTDFIPAFEGILLKVGWTWNLGIDDLRTKEDFTALINEFQQVDPGSYTFRYPIKKIGADSLPHHFSFNLQSFTKRMNPLLELLDGALVGLEQFHQGMENRDSI